MEGSVKGTTVHEPPNEVVERLRQQREEREAAEEGGLDPELLTGDDRKDAMRAAANAPRPETLPDEVQRDALDWLLSDMPTDDNGIVIGGTKTLKLDVSLPGQKPTWIDWVIRPIDADELRKAQREARGANRKERRSALSTGEQLDGREVNMRVVAYCTVSPDLEAASRQKLGINDPVAIIRRQFQFKPGIPDQIAAEIMTISGYDEDSVVIAEEADAAGN